MPEREPARRLTAVSRPAGKNSPETFVADFAVFDPATGKATALAPLQEARGNAQVYPETPRSRLF